MVRRLGFILVALLLLSAAASASDPSDAKEVVARMTEAHGGAAKWRATPSVSYDFVMYLEAIPMREGMSPWDRWGVSHNVIETGSGRAFADLPFEDASLAFDGKQVVNNNYKSGNPPFFRLWHHAGHVNLPWLAQDPQVVVGALREGKLPNDPKTYFIVRLTFNPPAGRKHEGYYDIYIDPETYLHRATLYTSMMFVTPKDLGPAEIPPMPAPFLRINQEFTTVNGLTFPTRYITYDPEGKQLFGYHMLMNISTSRSFDAELRMRSRMSDGM